MPRTSLQYRGFCTNRTAQTLVLRAWKDNDESIALTVTKSLEALTKKTACALGLDKATGVRPCDSMQFTSVYKPVVAGVCDMQGL